MTIELQSVELRVPDVEGTARFFEQVWGLTRVGNGGTAGLRGSAGLPYIIGLGRGPSAVRSITFCGTRAEIGREREMKGPEGERYRFVVETPLLPLAADRDRPIRLSHVVLNSQDADAAELKPSFATGRSGSRTSCSTPKMPTPRSASQSRSSASSFPTARGI